MTFSRRSILAAGALSAGAPVLAKSALPSVRGDFPITANGRAYLNSAYITPIPRQVADATAEFARGKSERQMEVRELLGTTERVRRKFAALINASADEVGLLFSTADGENVVASGLDLRPGDNVVIDDLHYDTEFVLYRQLEKTQGIELRVARNVGGAAGVEQFAPLVDKRTRLISIAWVSHRNGYLHDVKALADLAHAHGALLYADAIQAVGALHIDVQATGVDLLCAGGYKWLLAGWGVAPLYVRKTVLDRLRIDRFGEFNGEVAADGSVTIDPTARRFDYSSRAFGEAHAMAAALDYLDAAGVERIERHGVKLAQRLQRGAAKLGLELATPMGNASQIVTVNLPGDPDAVRKAFDSAGVDVTIRNGAARIACALFNTEDDIDRCLEVLRKLR